MSSTPDIHPVIDRVAGRTLPASVNAVSLALVALGVVAFLTGMFAIGDHGAVAWGSFLVGALYTFAIAQGGVMFSVIQTGTWGRWGRPVKRIAETFGFYLPVGYAAILVFLLFGLSIYPWNPSTVVGAPSFSTEYAASMTWQPMSPSEPQPKSYQARQLNGW